MKINRIRGKNERSLMRILCACSLIFSVCLGMPPFLSAHGGHTGTDVKVNGGDLSTSRIPAADWIQEKAGGYVPLGTVFSDSLGVRLSLDSIIDRPTLILPIYYFCPNSCSLDLAHLAAALKTTKFKPGVDFNVIAFSFNANETIADAKNAQVNYLKLLPDAFPPEAWKFLVGDLESIRALTEAVGYTFKRMADGSYVHPSALVVVAGDGRIIKYVYGSFLPGDVDIGIQEAKQGTPAVSIKRLLNYCFNNDSQKSLAFLQNLKLYVLIVFFILGTFFLWFLRKSGKKKYNPEEGHH
jgi:protein SCO1